MEFSFFLFLLLVCQILNCQASLSPAEIFDPSVQLVLLIYYYFVSLSTFHSAMTLN